MSRFVLALDSRNDFRHTLVYIEEKLKIDEPTITAKVYRVDFVDVAFEHLFRRQLYLRRIRDTAARVFDSRVLAFLLVFLYIMRK